eukprot:CAMPEP_0184393510 /NCGR_PEP_ID=MMETSP0007-20130409/34861_1 /TAXON_ID=97485 /ORGANISM="Prymnesium parvum, Strain Texoma1" /LENGTH=42 /DNA_ID= /DNA_START= /DNA_END= /DNA_ORIENTATION=
MTNPQFTHYVTRERQIGQHLLLEPLSTSSSKPSVKSLWNRSQ